MRPGPSRFPNWRLAKDSPKLPIHTPASRTSLTIPMKFMFSRFVFLALVITFAVAPLNASARTMADLPGVPLAGLHAYLPLEAYNKLVNAPIKAWIVVRGQIIGT